MSDKNKFITVNNKEDAEKLEELGMEEIFVDNYGHHYFENKGKINFKKANVKVRFTNKVNM